MAKIVPEFQQAFSSYLEAKGLSKKTFVNYNFFFHKFINRYGDLNQENVDMFLAHNSSSPARSMILNLKKSIVRWNFSQEIKSEVSIIDIAPRTSRKGRPTPKFIKKSDVDILDLKIKLGDIFSTERLKLMILTQFYAGLRENELLNLKLSDLNWRNLNQDNKFQIITISSDSAKFGKQRDAYLPTDIYLRLIRWIKVNISKSNKKFEDKPFFGLKKSRYDTLLRKVTLEILGEAYSTHALRHGRGNDLRVNEKKPIDFIKEYLGHASISSTQIYTHLSGADIKEELENS